jgi:glyoxylase-like metal-dependent hydrolase (beta-lactamase superfamily II)
LSIFSYYLESERQVYLIDPTYDVHPYRDLASKRGATITSILLTHYHVDYISGHTEFNLPIIMGPESIRDVTKLKLRMEVADHSICRLGSISVKVIHTPGHTLESSCFLLIDGKDH